MGLPGMVRFTGVGDGHLDDPLREAGAHCAGAVDRAAPRSKARVRASLSGGGAMMVIRPASIPHDKQ